MQEKKIVFITGSPLIIQCSCSDADDMFEQQIATELDALDDLDGGSPRADHVSCEDLLAFSTQAQSKSRGIDSDQVRIMKKVSTAKSNSYLFRG